MQPLPWSFCSQMLLWGMKDDLFAFHGRYDQVRDGNNSA